MTQIKYDLNFHVTVKETDQGLVGIVKELPVVIESPTEEQFQVDITKALAACFLDDPKAVQEYLSIKMPA